MLWFSAIQRKQFFDVVFNSQLTSFKEVAFDNYPLPKKFRSIMYHLFERTSFLYFSDFPQIREWGISATVFIPWIRVLAWLTRQWINPFALENSKICDHFLP